MNFIAVTDPLVLTIFTQKAQPNDYWCLHSNVFSTVTFIFKHVAFDQSLKEKLITCTPNPVVIKVYGKHSVIV
jgi:hypothetical protein